jgi:hypothetical protein
MYLKKGIIKQLCSVLFISACYTFFSFNIVSAQNLPALKHININSQYIEREAFKIKIEPIYDDFRYTESTDIPEFFENWNDELNPYSKRPMSDIDSSKIEVKGFFPPYKGKICSDFGVRGWRMHNGVDIKLQKGDTVHCAFDGVVRVSKSVRGGYGRYVMVRHTNGLETLYGHLSELLVEPNQLVHAGDIIGLGGSTGRAHGTHLHFEVRYLGNTINPHDLINFETYCSNCDTLVIGPKNFSYKHIAKRASSKYWTVRKGDTLYHIALKTGIPMTKLCKLNGIKKNTLLKLGRHLKLQ